MFQPSQSPGSISYSDETVEEDSFLDRLSKPKHVVQRVSKTTSLEDLAAENDFTAEETKLRVGLDRRAIEHIVDLIFHSDLPCVYLDAASSLAALSIREANLSTLSKGGALGAVLELCQHIKFKSQRKTEITFTQNCVVCLCNLTTQHDVCERLVDSAVGIRTVLRLLHRGTEEQKGLMLDVVLRIMDCEGGLRRLQRERVIDILLCPAVLTHAPPHMRQRAAALIQRIAELSPSHNVSLRAIERVILSGGAKDSEVELSLLNTIMVYFGSAVDVRDISAPGSSDVDLGADEYPLFRKFMEYIVLGRCASTTHLLRYMRCLVYASCSEEQVAHLVKWGAIDAVVFLLENDVVTQTKRQADAAAEKKEAGGRMVGADARSGGAGGALDPDKASMKELESAARSSMTQLLDTMTKRKSKRRSARPSTSGATPRGVPLANTTVSPGGRSKATRSSTGRGGDVQDGVGGGGASSGVDRGAVDALIVGANGTVTGSQAVKSSVEDTWLGLLRWCLLLSRNLCVSHREGIRLVSLQVVANASYRAQQVTSRADKRITRQLALLIHRLMNVYYEHVDAQRAASPLRPGSPMRPAAATPSSSASSSSSSHPQLGGSRPVSPELDLQGVDPAADRRERRKSRSAAALAAASKTLIDSQAAQVTEPPAEDAGTTHGMNAEAALREQRALEFLVTVLETKENYDMDASSEAFLALCSFRTIESDNTIFANEPFVAEVVNLGQNRRECLVPAIELLATGAVHAPNLGAMLRAAAMGLLLKPYLLPPRQKQQIAQLAILQDRCFRSIALMLQHPHGRHNLLHLGGLFVIVLEARKRGRKNEYYANIVWERLSDHFAAIFIQAFMRGVAYRCRVQRMQRAATLAAERAAEAERARVEAMERAREEEEAAKRKAEEEAAAAAEAARLKAIADAKRAEEEAAAAEAAAAAAAQAQAEEDERQRLAKDKQAAEAAAAKQKEEEAANSQHQDQEVQEVPAKDTREDAPEERPEDESEQTAAEATEVGQDEDQVPG